MILLEGISPLKETRWTYVFQHPTSAARLIKVKRARELNTAKFLTRFRPSARRFRHMRDWASEQSGYISALSHLNGTPDFLPAFHGYCQTDLGVGYVVEKITDAEGNLAPSFSEALKAGLDPVKGEQLIEAFFKKLRAASVVAGDLHTRNVVVAGDAERLVLIDGLGESSLVKLRTLSKFFCQRALVKREQRFTQLTKTPMTA